MSEVNEVNEVNKMKMIKIKDIKVLKDRIYLCLVGLLIKRSSAHLVTQ